MPYRCVPVLPKQEQLLAKCHDDAMCEPAARASTGLYRDSPSNLTALDVDQQCFAVGVLRLEEKAKQCLVNDGGTTKVARDTEVGDLRRSSVADVGDQE